MIGISDKVKCMASLATFRKMNMDGLTIYDVIGQLAGQIIIEKNVVSIDYASLRDMVKHEAGIDVPTSMFRPSLMRVAFVDTEKTQVKTNDKLTAKLRAETLELLEANKKRDETVYHTLIGFVEEMTHVVLSEEERVQLKKDFCSYIVNDAYNVKYAEHISKFLLVMEKDVSFMSQISEIREGLVIFLGLSYNVKDDQIDKVDSSLCLYLETEILFHMAGYNGELFKSFFDEFYEQVSAINKKASKPLVKLMFFEETNKEIDAYFSNAVDIVKGKNRLEISRTAMRKIVEGCKESYDVVQKKAEFLLLLKEKGITLDTQRNYYDRENTQFNVVQQQVLDELVSVETDEKKIYEKMCLINYVFIKRGQKAHQIFRNVGHILVSGNTQTFEVAKHMEQQPGDVPLVWGINTLTNRFWLTLNKGILPSAQLKSFDILSKARIIISNKVNGSVERLFKDIERDLVNGKMTQEKANIGIAELRRYNATPDVITAENADSYMSIFNEQSIEQLIAESEARQRKVQETIDRQAAIIKERDNSIANEKKVTKAAIKELTKQANASIKRQYDEDCAQYEAKRRNYVQSEYRKYAFNQVMITFVYFAVAFALYVVVYLFKKEVGFIDFLLELVVFIIPFIRPLANHLFIKKACQFLLCKKERLTVLESLKKDYEHENKRPVLKWKEESEVAKELRNSK